MRTRTGLIAGFSLCAPLLALTVAFAQGPTSGSSGLGAPANPTVPPSLSPSGSSIPQAPVGHFQPRRDAVPDDNSPYKESAEDKALDRKIKSICRGC